MKGAWINFFNQSLFVTNVWIIIYVNLIVFLNFLSPPVVKEQFYGPVSAFSEPFEMPLYLVLTFLFMLAIFLYRKFTSEFKIPAVIAFFVFLFLLGTFITKLGKFPMAHDFYPYTLRQDESIYNVVLFVYLAAMAFIISETTLFSKLIHRSYLLSFIYFLLAIFVIALLTFEPRFPISSHEYGYFFGPIWDVASGKTLFSDIHTDYGFYATLFFVTIYKVGLFQFSQLPIYVWIMFILQYFLSFYLIYRVSRSLPLAFIGLFSIITVNYFSFFVLPITITQYSAMRRLPSVFILFLLYKFKKMDSRLLFFVALIDFWIVDAGVSMLLAVGLTLFLLRLAKNISAKRFFALSFLMIFFQAGIFVFINLMHIAFGYKPINPLDIFNSLRQHAGSGLTMLPIESHTYFWIVMLIYFASIIYVFRKKLNKTDGESGKVGGTSEVTLREADCGIFAEPRSREGITSDRIYFFQNNQLLLFSANLSLFNALYFVGRSHDANLFDISILVLLNFFLLVGYLWRDISAKWVKIAAGALLFLLFIAFPAYNRRYVLTEFILEKYKRLQAGSIIIPETDMILAQTFSKDLQLISKHLKEKEILVLSKEDPYLLILSGKKNLLNVNPQSGINTVSEMSFAIERVSRTCPKKIVVDCRVYNKCLPYESYSQKSLFMAPYILEAVEKKCKIKYSPIECTNQLCIAQVL